MPVTVAALRGGPLLLEPAGVAAEVHTQVAGLLGHPDSSGMSGDAGDVCTP
jgi:hypothetical protein